MAKVKIYSIERSEKRRIINELFEVVSSLKTKAEIINFFIGLLTPSEVVMIARRIQIAKMLINEIGYEIIQRELKVSHTTINKVEHWLNENEDRNKLISNKIKKINKTKENIRTEKSLLDRYAHHKFLKEILK